MLRRDDDLGEPRLPTGGGALRSVGRRAASNRKQTQAQSKPAMHDLPPERGDHMISSQERTRLKSDPMHNSRGSSPRANPDPSTAATSAGNGRKRHRILV